MVRISTRIQPVAGAAPQSCPRGTQTCWPTAFQVPNMRRDAQPDRCRRSARGRPHCLPRGRSIASARHPRRVPRPARKLGVQAVPLQRRTSTRPSSRGAPSPGGCRLRGRGLRRAAAGLVPLRHDPDRRVPLLRPVGGTAAVPKRCCASCAGRIPGHAGPHVGNSPEACRFVLRRDAAGARGDVRTAGRGEAATSGRVRPRRLQHRHQRRRGRRADRRPPAHALDPPVSR